MKTIDCFDTLLHYVNRLGFAGSGNIQARQDALCCMCDAILAKAGAVLGPAHVGFPFKVRFHTYKAYSTGYTYPWLGWFDLQCADGTKKTLACRDVSVNQWISNGRK